MMKIPAIKTMFYERNLEKEASDEFYDSEDTSCIDFQGLVYEGDVIRSTDSFQETVTEVSLMEASIRRRK